MDGLKSVEISLNSAIESSERRESESRSSSVGPVTPVPLSPKAKHSAGSPASSASSSGLPSDGKPDGEPKTAREKIERVIDHHYCHVSQVEIAGEVSECIFSPSQRFSDFYLF